MSFPVTAGPDLTYNGNTDCFLARLKGDGTSLDYCGYIGGASGESCSGIAVDPIGNTYIAGYTSSDETTFPVTVGPDLTYNGAPPKEGDGFAAKITAYHIFVREGNVNRGAGNAADILFFNGSSGNAQRKMTITSGAWVSATMSAPPTGPSPAGFLLYVWPAEAGPQDSTVQPFGIGTACFPTPLSKGTAFPPPFTVANNVGYYKVLGYPTIPNVPMAPSTIFNLPIPFQGTYTFQGFIFDTGSSGPGFSITNAIVLEVQ